MHGEMFSMSEEEMNLRGGAVDMSLGDGQEKLGIVIGGEISSLPSFGMSTRKRKPVVSHSQSPITDLAPKRNVKTLRMAKEINVEESTINFGERSCGGGRPSGVQEPPLWQDFPDQLTYHETEEEANEIWEEESYGPDLLINLTEKRSKLLEDHWKWRTFYRKDNKVKHERLLRLEKARNESRMLENAGLGEPGNLQEINNTIDLVVVDEGGVTVSVDTKTGITAFMAGSLLFRRLASRTQRFIILGESMKLEANKIKTEMLRRDAVGLEALIDDIHVDSEDDRLEVSLSLKVKALCQLPVAANKEKWHMFVGLEYWDDCILGWDSFLPNGRKVDDFESLRLAMENAEWLLIGAFGLDVASIFRRVYGRINDTMVIDMMKIDFVKWMVLTKWRAFWAVLKAPYRVNEIRVSLENGAWWPLWDAIVDQIVFTKVKQTTYLEYIVPRLTTAVKATSASRTSVSSSVVVVKKSPVNVPAVPKPPTTYVCLDNIAFELGLTRGGILVKPCTRVGCRFNHDWKAMGKATVLQNIASSSAVWLNEPNARAMLTTAVGKIQF
jgi:hypothetical protein